MGVPADHGLHVRIGEQARLDAQEALDDPLVMAGRRLSGEAFVGEVTDVAMAHSEDTIEGPKAFAEKRKPDWKGR